MKLWQVVWKHKTWKFVQKMELKKLIPYLSQKGQHLNIGIPIVNFEELQLLKSWVQDSESWAPTSSFLYFSTFLQS